MFTSGRKGKNLKEQKACVLQNIGVLYGREGDLSKAEYYLKEALLHEPDSDGLIKIYTHFVGSVY